ncbi:MFS transporter [Atlantibacter subterraneus]|uniref:MFS transporter n=1 Tax=Atlantibacter subterraneus TaxID=255519 RepID=UPI0028977381|nr:MFS transporter [Atlantibacter subterranea]
MKTAVKGRLAVSTLFYINGFITGAWAVQIAQLAPRFDITDKVIGHLILIFGLGALFMMPLSGILMEKYSSQRIVRIFSICTSVALIPVGIVSQLSLLIPTLFLLGAMTGAMNVAMNANAVAVEKRLFWAILSSCHCCWSIGLFIASIMGGFMVEQFGFLIHILFVSGIALVITLSACPYIVNDVITKPIQHLNKTHLPRSPSIYLIGCLALFAMIPECAVVDWSSRYLMKNFNATPATASIALGCFAGAMAIIRFMGDAFRNRFGGIIVLRSSSLLAGSGLFAAAMVNNPWYAIIAFTITGIGIANLVPVIFSLAGNHSDISASTGMSIVTTIGYLGTLMAPAPVGIIAELTGFPCVYTGMAIMLALIFIFAPLVRGTQIYSPLSG